MAAGLLMSVSAASATTVTPLTLEVTPDGIGTHPGDSPCIISGTNCPGQTGLAYTGYKNTGNTTSINKNSPTYTVSQISGVVGTQFSVGLDVNQAKKAQTLDYFAMSVNGVVLYEYNGSAGNVPKVNNGTGHADYLLTGFDLTGFAPGDSVIFTAKMSGLNAGAEQFFLVPAQIPVPAAGILLIGALGSLVWLGRRKTTV
jgi:hypothetical protein